MQSRLLIQVLLLFWASLLLSNASTLAKMGRVADDGFPRLTAERTEPAKSYPISLTNLRVATTRESAQRFIEFRGEFAYPPGNTVLRYGYLGPDGEPADYKVVAHQPAYGALGIILGTIVPVKTYVGSYPWDDVVPAMSSYRVNVTEEQYQKFINYVETYHETHKTFYLYTDNCVKFGQGAARVIGLKAPDDTLLIPPVYVNMLRIMNEGNRTTAQ